MNDGKVIWKFPLDTGAGKNTFNMPGGAEILTVQLQGGVPVVWALVDASLETKARRTLRIHQTGASWSQSFGRYVGTYQDGSLVWHLFDEGELTVSQFPEPSDKAPSASVKWVKAPVSDNQAAVEVIEALAARWIGKNERLKELLQHAVTRDQEHDRGSIACGPCDDIQAVLDSLKNSEEQRGGIPK